MANTLSNTNFLNVTVSLTTAVPAQTNFSIPCFTDASGVVSQAQGTQRYTSTAAMLTAGFTTSSVAYLQAEAIFGQTYPPPYIVVGAQDATALQTIVIHSGSAGTGYAVGNTFSIAGGTGGVGTVTAVTSGVPTAISVTTQGTGYTVSTAHTTTALTGSGTGLEVDVTVIGMTPLQAVTLARNSDSSWYTIFCSTAADADHLAIAAWAESQSTPTWYNITTSDATVLSGATNNLALELMNGTYNHTSIQYATTQSGLFPSNAYASLAQTAGFLGLTASGTSATAAFKTIPTIQPEPITQSNYATLTGQNCNVYAPFQAGNLFSPGIMAGGWYMDDRIGLDALIADVQNSVMSELVDQPKIAQTNDGESIIINAINAACERAVTSGFIARASQWNGAPIAVLGLSTGDSLPKGYLAGAASFTTQSASARSARDAMPISVVIGLAGAIQNISIAFSVQS